MINDLGGINASLGLIDILTEYTIQTPPDASQTPYSRP